MFFCDSKSLRSTDLFWVFRLLCRTSGLELEILESESLEGGRGRELRHTLCFPFVWKEVVVLWPNNVFDGTPKGPF